MNRVLCKSSLPGQVEQHLTPRQIWDFIEHIGVWDKTNLEEVVRRNGDMEQRDWAMFQQIASAVVAAPGFSLVLLFWGFGTHWVLGAVGGVGENFPSAATDFEAPLFAELGQQQLEEILSVVGHPVASGFGSPLFSFLGSGWAGEVVAPCWFCWFCWLFVR
ncbi:hypothetical protein Ancab_014254 [Ancistrocladus abbreviatus]